MQANTTLRFINNNEAQQTLLFFYVGVLFLTGYSCNQIAVLAKLSADSQTVCYIFLKNSQLFFRIYSGFSGSLSVYRCWVNDVHVAGL